ncbi:nucleoside triphosphate hydrolase [Nocardia sp. NPDC003963]
MTARGDLPRKGEPDTFDVAGFVSRLAILRESRSGSPVPWPTFDRELDDPVPGGVVFTTQRIAVVEGNYLLLDRPGWREVRRYLDTVWYLDAADAVIEPRLRYRHLDGGRSAAETEHKIARSDLPNARSIAGTRSRADVHLRERSGSYLVEKSQ